MGVAVIRFTKKEIRNMKTSLDVYKGHKYAGCPFGALHLYSSKKRNAICHSKCGNIFPSIMKTIDEYSAVMCPCDVITSKEYFIRKVSRIIKENNG